MRSLYKSKLFSSFRFPYANKKFRFQASKRAVSASRLPLIVLQDSPIISFALYEQVQVKCGTMRCAISRLRPACISRQSTIVSLKPNLWIFRNFTMNIITLINLWEIAVCKRCIYSKCQNLNSSISVLLFSYKATTSNTYMEYSQFKP